MSLTGYRWWYAAHRPETGWQLRPVFQRRWWHGPHYEAPAPPRSRNSCGIHAFKTWELAADAIQIGTDSLYPVFGVVALWGKVVEHERGYRAEHAMIRRLIVPGRIVFNQRSRLEDPCRFVDLDDILTKRQEPPSPAPLLGGCVIAGARKWQRTAEKTPDRSTEEKTPDRAMIPALARVYGVDVELGPPVVYGTAA